LENIFSVFAKKINNSNLGLEMVGVALRTRAKHLAPFDHFDRHHHLSPC
jgi:hypothetical protein